MLEALQVAPEFELQTQTGETVSLSSLRGKTVVLYFYPKDDTPGCTTEACAFRDLTMDFERAGAVVLGISRDTVKSHEKFVTKYGLSFPLLADETGEVCEAYGVLQEKNMYGKKSIGIVRSTFIIDKEGVIAKVYPKVKVDGHAEEVLEFVKSLG